MGLERAIELDNSPARLIQYAETALTKSWRQSEPPLSGLARDLINRALDQFAGSELDPDIDLRAAQVLVKSKTEDYALVTQLLAQDLPQQDAHRRPLVISVYLSLSELAKDRGQVELYEECIRNAANLSIDLNEFLKLRTGDNLAQQLLIALKEWAILNKAPWYDQKIEAETISSIISIADFRRTGRYYGREILFALLDRYGQIPVNQLTTWLKMLFRTDLSLTAGDIQQIELLSKSFPRKLRNVIRKGLSSQAKRESESSGAMSTELITGININQSIGIVGNVNSIAIGGDIIAAGRDIKAAGNIVVEEVEPEQPAIKVERHTRIDFPSDCVLDRRVELHIQLTKDVPRMTRAFQRVVFAVNPEVKQATLDVQVTAPGFAIQKSRRTLVLPLNGDSEEITFTLVPLEEGEQIVEIEFFHRSSRVGYVLVKTRVSKWSFTPRPSNVVTMEDPVNTLQSIATKDKRLARRTLHVNWSKVEGKLFYTIYSDDPNEFGEWEQNSPQAQEQIATYLQSLNALLTEVVTQGNPTEEVWESIGFNLQSVCESLFKTLVPTQVAERVQKWDQGSYVIISTNEQWIPWELMYDGQSHWGDKFIIARYPRLSNRQNMPTSDRPEGKIAQKIRKVVNVVGGEVPPNEGQRASQLFKMLPSSLVMLLKEEPISALLKALPGTDAVHFTCHGYLEPPLLRIAKDKSRTQNIILEAVQKLPLEVGSLAFVNACTSTAPVLIFGKFSNFGWEFYRRGAGVFIGTLGAVPTKYAVSFAEAVYNELFCKDTKQTIGQAVASAKKIAEHEHNLFWLLYCIYGDPDFTIETP
jgi:CHAT domain-containing protein